MASTIMQLAACDVLDITIHPAKMYDVYGQTNVLANMVVIKVMGDTWGMAGIVSVIVPKRHMRNFWPIRNMVTNLPEIPRAILHTSGALMPGTYAFTDIIVSPITLTNTQRAALRRAANGDIGKSTLPGTINALHDAGYLAPGTTTITKAGRSYLDYCTQTQSRRNV